MITGFIKRHQSLLELALRIYIAYYLVDYGVSKLTGGMFNNATPQILQTPLQEVDLFHLTWYFFYKSKLLSYSVGIFQMLSAVLLVFNRTVLVGCAIAIPIFINILLVDIGAFPDHGLAIRILLYLCSVVYFVIYRRAALILAYRQYMINRPRFELRNKYSLLFIPVLLIFYLIAEIVLSRGLAVIFR